MRVFLLVFMSRKYVLGVMLFGVLIFIIVILFFFGDVFWIFSWYGL